MKLSEKQFKPINRLCGRDCARWAIVKDYIAHPVSIADVSEIRRKLCIVRKALLFPNDAQPRNYCGSFFVDLGGVWTYPYIKGLWSNKLWREFFEWFDRDVAGWQVSIRDGTIVPGWQNETLKEIEAQSQERKRWRRQKGLPEEPMLFEDSSE